MPIKSILVHLANDPDHMDRLKVAYETARLFDAHLRAVYITTPIHSPAGAEGRGASAAFLQEAKDAALARAAEVEAELQEWAKINPVDFDMIRDEGDHLETMAKHTLTCDLAIVSQHNPENLEERLFDETPDKLAVKAACPVVILPHGYKHQKAPEHVCILWKPTHDSGRTLTDALPFLKLAKKVSIVSTMKKEGEICSADDVQLYLQRHGITAALTRLDKGSNSAASVFLDHVEKVNADLVVLGSLGQSRLRSIVFGDVTRQVLDKTHVPVIMSH
jgi:nucleotide-binding universal stress UspA family protein